MAIVNSILSNTVADQAKMIADLEHKVKESERKEASAIREKNMAIKELEQLKKIMSSDFKSVDQLKQQLQEEHRTNASLIIFNR
jgi:predicted RNase H-like nuclease (RuvC/YqgF family)